LVKEKIPGESGVRWRAPGAAAGENGFAVCGRCVFASRLSACEKRRQADLAEHVVVWER